MTTPTPLQYGRAPSTRRSRAMLLAALLGLVVLGYALYRQYPALSNWYALVTLHHAALTHTLSPDTPALTLLSTDNESNYDGRCPPIDATWQDAQARLITRPSSSPGSFVTLFLHERRTPAGHPRLVALNMNIARSRDGAWLRVDLRLFDPGSLRAPRLTELTVHPNPALPTDGSIPGFPGACLLLGTVPWGSDFRLYPAQPDPADPARFSLGYTLNGRRGSFVFQLTDDDSAAVTSSDGRRLPLRFPLPATQP